jgi:hypothetical protein
LVARLAPAGAGGGGGGGGSGGGGGGYTPFTLVPEIKLMTDGQTALLGSLTQATTWLPDHSYEAADLALEAANDDMAPSAGSSERTGTHWAPFAGIDGARIKNIGDDSSEIVTTSSRVMAGLALQSKSDSAKFMGALFLEGVLSRYHTEGYYGAAPFTFVRGKGEMTAVDIGLMLRHTWDRGFRIEASGRFGMAEFEFDSPSFNLAYGADVSYEYHTPFLGAHFGLGYEHTINDVSTLDFSGRYFFTRLKGADVVLRTGDDVDFQDATSSRVRGGLRYKRRHNPRMSWYLGAYYEHEFDGQAEVIVHGMDYASDELDGPTGIGEVGVIFKSTPDTPWAVEAGIQGYAGVNRGFSVGVRFAYEF